MAELLSKGEPQNKQFQTVLGRVVDDWSKDKRNNKEELVSRLGVNYRVFQFWLEHKRCIPAEKIPLLCNALSDYRLLDLLEKDAGRIAFHLPEVSKLPQMEDVRAIQRLVKEVGEALEALSSTLADGKVEQHELEKTIPELNDVVRECTRLKHWLEVRCREDARKGVPGRSAN
jgi:hypothetical protein